MDKIYVNPQIFAVVSYLDSIVKEVKSFGVMTMKTSYIKPQLFGVHTNKDTYVKPQAFGVISENKTFFKPKLFGVMTIPKIPQTHSHLYTQMDIAKRVNIKQKATQIKFDVKQNEKDTTIYPYITYQFNNKEQVYQYPYITYNEINGLDVNEYPYITYHDSDFGAGKKSIRQWYFNFYMEKWGKTVKCKMYDNTEGFPLQNAHLSCYCSDGKTRYVPLDRLDSDFDSGMRVTDEYGNELQICVARQDNIINKYFPFGDILIPMTTYTELYAIFCGIFGRAHIKMASDGKGIYFTPPNPITGISQMFVIGLNIRITNKYGVELTTYNNGLQTTSFGGDQNWFANAMLIKFNKGETFKIEFNDEYYGTSYDSSALVKNAIVFGMTTESLPRYSYSFEQLNRNYKWFLYDVKTNYIHCVDLTNKYINYFRSAYLSYINSRHTYNYYDLSKLRYQTDIT